MPIAVAESYEMTSVANSKTEAVAYRGGWGWFGGSNPPPEIPKALQNRAKLNPIVKTVKNCWI